MNDMTRGTLGFLGGVVIGILTMMFVWGITNCEYAPSYGITQMN